MSRPVQLHHVTNTSVTYRVHDDPSALSDTREGTRRKADVLLAAMPTSQSRKRKSPHDAANVSVRMKRKLVARIAIKDIDLRRVDRGNLSEEMCRAVDKILIERKQARNRYQRKTQRHTTKGTKLERYELKLNATIRGDADGLVMTDEQAEELRTAGYVVLKFVPMDVAKDLKRMCKAIGSGPKPTGAGLVFQDFVQGTAGKEVEHDLHRLQIPLYGAPAKTGHQRDLSTAAFKIFTAAAAMLNRTFPVADRTDRTVYKPVLLRSARNGTEQAPHRDYHWRDVIVPPSELGIPQSGAPWSNFGAILSIETGTRLRVLPFSHLYIGRGSSRVIRRLDVVEDGNWGKLVKPGCGELVIFHGGLVHAGCAYDTENERLHAYIGRSDPDENSTDLASVTFRSRLSSTETGALWETVLEGACPRSPADSGLGRPLLVVAEWRKRSTVHSKSLAFAFRTCHSPEQWARCC